MKVRVVLVETEYSSNLGSVCRVMKNFGFSELYTVNMKCRINIDAYKGAKHAKDILQKMKKVRGWEQAIKGCDFVIGTTGVKVRNKGTIRGVVPLRDFAKRMKYYDGKRIALVFGREGIGLNQDELNKCDLLLNIESSETYPVLNISHAAAIALYTLADRKGGQGENAPKKQELEAMHRIFKTLCTTLQTKNKRGPVALKRVVGRAQANEHEVRALLNVFRELMEVMDKSGEIRKGVNKQKIVLNP
ncbi:RNA methyltransferase [Candidatus Micrarchaeota archaeon]|nr:RNA methyltransferase [Candidatus Micrarchaeota archaeon]